MPPGASAKRAVSSTVPAARYVAELYSYGGCEWNKPKHAGPPIVGLANLVTEDMNDKVTSGMGSLEYSASG